MTMESFATEALTPDETERAAAEKLSRELASRLAQGEAINVMLSGDGPGAQYDLTVTATKLLVKILAEIAKGNAVAVVGLKPELTTQEAAELLNVSGSYLVKLLEQGEIPFHKVETHRRIRLADVLAYKRESLEKRKAILKEMVALNHEMGLYD